jgi:hypothetical protein
VVYTVVAVPDMVEDTRAVVDIAQGVDKPEEADRVAADKPVAQAGWQQGRRPVGRMSRRSENREQWVVRNRCRIEPFIPPSGYCSLLL